MVERQLVMRMIKRLFGCKKYKKKFIESLLFHEMRYVNGRKSKYIFQKFIIINVLRATSEQKTSNPFFN